MKTLLEKHAFKSIKVLLKADSEDGEVTARFATLNVVDHDGDITVPGAFGKQDVRLTAWGHNTRLPSIGRGAIHEDSDAAILDATFFMDTTHGLDTFRTVRGLGDLQEWSYEYDVIDAEFGTNAGERVRYLKSLMVHGVAPVYKGAGIDTATLDIKSDCAACAEKLQTLTQLLKQGTLSQEDVERIAKQFGIELPPVTPPGDTTSTDAPPGDLDPTADLEAKAKEDTVSVFKAFQRQRALYGVRT